VHAICPVLLPSRWLRDVGQGRIDLAQAMPACTLAEAGTASRRRP
jgi:hypothetical protein